MRNRFFLLLFILGEKIIESYLIYFLRVKNMFSSIFNYQEEPKEGTTDRPLEPLRTLSRASAA
jgi:hypothetical protein